MSLPPYLSREEIHRRLPLIFPSGVAHRNYCVREAAASTIFAMLYTGAIEGADRWIAPKHVMRMTAEQSALCSDADRNAYSDDVMRPGFQAAGKLWYRENSREQIRDETLRQGFITNNAAVERSGIATTANVPRYALRAEFAALFHPALVGEFFDAAVTAWQNKALSAAALARTTMIRRGAASGGEEILVTFPSGETRRLAPGPSSPITKAVIEQFATAFLQDPAVLWLSESRNKVVSRDDDLAALLKINISADKTLPDVILVDLGDGNPDRVMLIFVEVVATDGPVTPARQAAFLALATEARFPPQRVAHVSAFLDRSHQAFKKAVPDLAWHSFAWFAAEPNQIMVLCDGTKTGARLLDLL